MIIEVYPTARLCPLRVNKTKVHMDPVALVSARAAHELARAIQQPEHAQFVLRFLGVVWLGDSATYAKASRKCLHANQDGRFFLAPSSSPGSPRSSAPMGLSPPPSAPGASSSSQRSSSPDPPDQPDPPNELQLQPKARLRPLKKFKTKLSPVDFTTMRAADELERVVQQPEHAQFVRIVLGVDWLGDTCTYKKAQARQAQRLRTKRDRSGRDQDRSGRD